MKVEIRTYKLITEIQLMTLPTRWGPNHPNNFKVSWDAETGRIEADLGDEGLLVCYMFGNVLITAEDDAEKADLLVVRLVGTERRAFTAEHLDLSIKKEEFEKALPLNFVKWIYSRSLPKEFWTGHPLEHSRGSNRIEEWRRGVADRVNEVVMYMRAE